MQFSKFVITLVIMLNIIFTAVVLFIFYRIGSEPTVLIGAWFGFMISEVWALSKIKRAEVEKDTDK